ncbi:MAG: SufE family protein [Phycisphaerales bacterium]|nr:SufE family protein [Phycisphaerales bacterium]
MLPTLDELKEAFAFLDDWEDRYRYIMDLGAKLQPLDAEDRIDANLVHGCQSTVWVVLKRTRDAVDMTADSDSQLVKGLAAIVICALQGRTPKAIIDFDLDALFAELRLHEHLSPTRSNGLHGMVRQVRSRAAAIEANC